MKKTILTLLLVIMAMAEATAQTLVVTKTNGQTVEYDLDEKPVTTFEGTNLVITTSGAKITYALSEVRNYTYKDVVSGVEVIKQSSAVSVKQQGDNLSLSNLPEGTTVKVYAVNGTLLSTHVADGHKPICISVAAQPVGMYIVKVGDQSIKILKK
jgi:hypothetical protein